MVKECNNTTAACFALSSLRSIDLSFKADVDPGSQNTRDDATAPLWQAICDCVGNKWKKF